MNKPNQIFMEVVVQFKILCLMQYASDPFDNGTIKTGNALMNNMKEEKTTK